MSKVLVLFFGICLTQAALAASTTKSADSSTVPVISSTVEPKENLSEENSTDSYEDVIDPAQNLLAAMYKRAMVQQIQTKVTEMQAKVHKGESPLQPAIELFKLVLFAQPTKDQIKKAAERAISLIPPELRKKTFEPMQATDETESSTPEED
jgi:hypothetical protein